LKGWAAVHDVELAANPYDIYTKGIDGSFSTDGEFITYWPLKAPGSK
jgi:hypothetical protein